MKFQRSGEPRRNEGATVRTKPRQLTRALRRKFEAGAAGSLAALFVAAPCLAHHSFAMFELRQSLSLQGAVREFQWTNPHCFIQLVVSSEGATNEWSVEMMSPSDMYRHGWRPGTLKPGEKVTVVVRPNRDGTKGGLFVSAVSADGRALTPERTIAGPQS